MFRNPDHVTVAVADPERATKFFELLGFKKGHVAVIDGDAPAKYMGMPDMKAEHITLVLEGCTPRFEIQLLAFDRVPAGADDWAFWGTRPQSIAGPASTLLAHTRSVPRRRACAGLRT